MRSLQKNLIGVLPKIICRQLPWFRLLHRMSLSERVLECLRFWRLQVW